MQHVDARCRGQARVAVGLAVTAADGVEFQAAEQRPGGAGAIPVAVPLGLLAVLLRRALAVVRAGGGGALPGVQHVHPGRSGQARVPIRHTVAAADRGVELGAGVGEVEAHPRPLAQPCGPRAVLAPPPEIAHAVRVALARDDALPGVQHVDARCRGQARVAVGLAVTAADGVEFQAAGQRPGGAGAIPVAVGDVLAAVVARVAVGVDLAGGPRAGLRVHAVPAAVLVGEHGAIRTLRRQRVAQQLGPVVARQVALVQRDAQPAARHDREPLACGAPGRPVGASQRRAISAQRVHARARDAGQASLVVVHIERHELGAARTVAVDDLERVRTARAQLRVPGAPLGAGRRARHRVHADPAAVLDGQHAAVRTVRRQRVARQVRAVATGQLARLQGDALPAAHHDGELLARRARRGCVFTGQHGAISTRRVDAPAVVPDHAALLVVHVGVVQDRPLVAVANVDGVERRAARAQLGVPVGPGLARQGTSDRVDAEPAAALHGEDRTSSAVGAGLVAHDVGPVPAQQLALLRREALPAAALDAELPARGAGRGVEVADQLGAVPAHRVHAPAGQADEAARRVVFVEEHHPRALGTRALLRDPRRAGAAGSQLDVPDLAVGTGRGAGHRIHAQPAALLDGEDRALGTLGSRGVAGQEGPVRARQDTGLERERRAAHELALHAIQHRQPGPVVAAHQATRHGRQAERQIVGTGVIGQQRVLERQDVDAAHIAALAFEEQRLVGGAVIGPLLDERDDRSAEGQPHLDRAARAGARALGHDVAAPEVTDRALGRRLLVFVEPAAHLVALLDGERCRDAGRRCASVVGHDVQGPVEAQHGLRCQAAHVAARAGRLNDDLSVLAVARAFDDQRLVREPAAQGLAGLQPQRRTTGELALGRRTQLTLALELAADLLAPGHPGRHAALEGAVPEGHHRPRLQRRIQATHGVARARRHQALTVPARALALDAQREAAQSEQRVLELVLAAHQRALARSQLDPAEPGAEATRRGHHRVPGVAADRLALRYRHRREPVRMLDADIVRLDPRLAVSLAREHPRQRRREAAHVVTLPFMEQGLPVAAGPDPLPDLVLPSRAAHRLARLEGQHRGARGQARSLGQDLGTSPGVAAHLDAPVERQRGGRLLCARAVGHDAPLQLRVHAADVAALRVGHRHLALRAGADPLDVEPEAPEAQELVHELLETAHQRALTRRQLDPAQRTAQTARQRLDLVTAVAAHLLAAVDRPGDPAGLTADALRVAHRARRQARRRVRRQGRAAGLLAHARVQQRLVAQARPLALDHQPDPRVEAA